jgi:16S rRNA (cytosine1402-N4)-methyltransferase
MDEFQHASVLLTEAIEFLNPKPGQVFLDCTLGAGGHSELILQHLNGNGLVIGLDQDSQAITAATERLACYGSAFHAMRYNFKELDQAIAEAGYEKVDGILFDLGVSSPQFDFEERGFSYWGNAVLDMRMDQRQAMTAADLLMSASQAELTSIIRDYGEEKWASRVAQFIVEARKTKPVQTADQLVEIIKAAIPASARREGGHPAKRTFQALRIAVNQELDVLKIGLEKAIHHLRPGGIIVVITFHSLEDRIVKHFFRQQANPCICPPKAPICVCGRQPSLRSLTGKPVIAGTHEITLNPRAKSAKLRAAVKL